MLLGVVPYFEDFEIWARHVEVRCGYVDGLRHYSCVWWRDGKRFDDRGFHSALIDKAFFPQPSQHDVTCQQHDGHVSSIQIRSNSNNRLPLFHSK